MTRTTTLALALAAALAGCTASGAASQRGPSPSKVAETGIAPGVVDGKTAHALVAAGVVAVDVRTPAEFATGHVPGALNIPYDEMAARHGELGPPSTPVLVYCQSGRRSGLAIETLRANGFARIYDLQTYGRWLAAEPAPAAK